MSLSLCKKIQDFNIETLSFNATIKNKIIKGDSSLFTGINIEFDSVVLNNACLVFSIKDPFIINYNTTDNMTTKYKCILDYIKNKKVISLLEKIENDILEKYSKRHTIKNLQKITTLQSSTSELYHIKFYSNTIKKNSIIERYTLNDKCMIDPHKKIFVLKISGVWENNGKIGVSYKISSL